MHQTRVIVEGAWQTQPEAADDDLPRHQICANWLQQFGDLRTHCLWLRALQRHLLLKEYLAGKGYTDHTKAFDGHLHADQNPTYRIELQRGGWPTKTI